jgi:HSP20 family protein
MGLPVLRGRRDGDSPVASWRTQEAPWAEFSELYERMGRLLSDAFTGLNQTAEGWRPAADVEETDDAYLVELELPGVKQGDISVELGGGELAITGEVKQRQRVGLLRSRTRRVGRFDYRISLPADIEEEQVSVNVKRGAHRASAEDRQGPTPKDSDHQLNQSEWTRRAPRSPPDVIWQPFSRGQRYVHSVDPMVLQSLLRGTHTRQVTDRRDDA